MVSVEPAAGRREQNKLATRTALRQAAARLIAEQGYEATTVRQIARSAGVGERTFYRYFDGKDDLLAGEALAWIDAVAAAIAGRPAAEPPYLAVARGMAELAGQVAAGTGPGASWLLAAEPSSAAQPLALVRRVAPRPLRRLERAIAAAVLARSGQGDPAAGADRAGRTDRADRVEPTDPADRAGALPAERQADLLGRVAVAALRTAVLWRREQVASGAGTGAAGPGLDRILLDVFDDLAELAASRDLSRAFR